MNKEELIQKLEDIEWEDFEVKEALSDIPKNSWETVSAFSNTAGGWLVFGVRKMGKQYELLGVKNPEKIEQDFTTTLRSEKFNQKIKPQLKKYTFDLELHQKYAESSQKSPRKVPEKSQKIIEALRENPYFSRRDLSLELGESEDTVQSRLRKLVKDGVIRRIGPDKGGHWEVLG